MHKRHLLPFTIERCLNHYIPQLTTILQVLELCATAFPRLYRLIKLHLIFYSIQRIMSMNILLILLSKITLSSSFQSIRYRLPFFHPKPPFDLLNTHHPTLIDLPLSSQDHNLLLELLLGLLFQPVLIR